MMSAKAAGKNPKSYKQMSEELSAIIEWFEEQEPDLDEAVDKYEQAVELISQMEDYLKKTENKVRKITQSLQ
ncbi:exodeoxyribonuclease VII small subunit [Candidatus Saccharibacteria bacterium]|nr:exodeoxyribonuclease VII small subunit [Candidatus Saccharibacteria bacterium]